MVKYQRLRIRDLFATILRLSILIRHSNKNAARIPCPLKKLYMCDVLLKQTKEQLLLLVQIIALHQEIKAHIQYGHLLRLFLMVHQLT